MADIFDLFSLLFLSVVLLQECLVLLIHLHQCRKVILDGTGLKHVKELEYTSDTGMRPSMSLMIRI